MRLGKIPFTRNISDLSLHQKKCVNPKTTKEYEEFSLSVDGSLGVSPCKCERTG
jgi:hypothetical protein